MDEINEANEAAQPEETIIMQIFVTRNGEMKIQSPLMNDKMALYGILETAKDAIRELHAPKIVRPTGGIMGFVRGNGRH